MSIFAKLMEILPNMYIFEKFEDHRPLSTSYSDYHIWSYTIYGILKSVISQLLKVLAQIFVDLYPHAIFWGEQHDKKF